MHILGVTIVAAIVIVISLGVLVGLILWTAALVDTWIEERDQ